VSADAVHARATSGSFRPGAENSSGDVVPEHDGTGSINVQHVYPSTQGKHGRIVSSTCVFLAT
jgi:hypothetical protein